MFEAYCVDFNTTPESAVKCWIAIIVIPMIIFSWIRNLDSLAPFSMFANLCTIVGLIMIVYAEVTKLVHSEASVEIHTKDLKQFHVAGLALFFGNAVFSFEGIGVVSCTSCFVIILNFKI